MFFKATAWGLGVSGVHPMAFQTVSASIDQGGFLQAIVPFRVAVNALCMLGVGSRAKQAEAIFRVCDEDKSRSLERLLSSD